MIWGARGPESGGAGELCTRMLVAATDVGGVPDDRHIRPDRAIARRMTSGFPAIHTRLAAGPGAKSTPSPLLSSNPCASSAISIPKSQLLRYAGLFTWVCVGISAALHSAPERMAAASQTWSAPVVAYPGVRAGLLDTRSGDGRRQSALGLPCWTLVAMTLSSLAIGHLTGTGIGAILILVCGVLPWVLPAGQGVFWLLLQNLGMLPVFLAPQFRLAGGDVAGRALSEPVYADVR